MSWFSSWLWELLDSTGMFSLGWFDDLLPEMPNLLPEMPNVLPEMFFGSAREVVLEGAAEAAVEAAEAVEDEAALLDAAGAVVADDDDGLFADIPGPEAGLEEGMASTLVGAAAEAAAAAASAAAARCGPGTVWDEGSGFCVVAEGAVEEAAAALAASDGGWFWWCVFEYTNDFPFNNDDFMLTKC